MAWRTFEGESLPSGGAQGALARLQRPQIPRDPPDLRPHKSEFQTAGCVASHFSKSARSGAPQFVLVDIQRQTRLILSTLMGPTRLGRVGAAISVVNDPSATNLVMTGAAFVPVLGEGVGAVTAVQDVGMPVAEGITNHVIAPMFDAAPPQNIEDGSGHLIPNPALMDECQALGCP
jgi:hypothetical protein